ncbi:MAG TPA: hypothetical protein DD666_08045 [Advenella kashmirensis]|uniref:Uncharacterized protein n=1 Tax=Advenella kashmirensis TaxID=310575 RepID=A0A356LEM5_9BURK|nr:hypothetical protein [Advenella kashmirensis]
MLMIVSSCRVEIWSVARLFLNLSFFGGIFHSPNYNYKLHLTLPTFFQVADFILIPQPAFVRKVSQLSMYQQLPCVTLLI